MSRKWYQKYYKSKNETKLKTKKSRALKSVISYNNIHNACVQYTLYTIHNHYPNLMSFNRFST